MELEPGLFLAVWTFNVRIAHDARELLHEMSRRPVLIFSAHTLHMVLAIRCLLQQSNTVDYKFLYIDRGQMKLPF